MRSLYMDDKFCEECLSDWLDEHFYHDFIPTGEHFYKSFTPKDMVFNRVTNKDLQKIGVDVAIDLPTFKYKIDEKATLHYINQNISTFAFELLNRTSGNKGWLFNPNYITTHYLLCWPNGELPIRSKDSFTWVEIMIIDRKKIIDYLNSVGLTYDFITNKVAKFSSLVTAKNYKFQLTHGIKLFFTEWLQEKPVNLVISKSILINIADFHGVIK